MKLGIVKLCIAYNVDMDSVESVGEATNKLVNDITSLVSNGRLLDCIGVEEDTIRDPADLEELTDEDVNDLLTKLNSDDGPVDDLSTDNDNDYWGEDDGE